jgi:hypothetical protein
MLRLSYAGLTRVSIFFVKMDCRVKRAEDGASRLLPGNDGFSYPLTRSTRATTALARNWAMMALRCLRS